MRRSLFFEGPQRTLAAADLAAIGLFSLIGVLSHDHGLTALRVLRDAGPLAAGWLAAALLCGAYRRPGWRTLLATWAIGVSAGVLLRAAILGRTLDGKQAAFLVTTLIATLILVLVLRLAGRLIASRLAHA
jgi:hypothetical protein